METISGKGTVAMMNEEAGAIKGLTVSDLQNIISSAAQAAAATFNQASRQNPDSIQSKPENPKRPTISTGCTPEKWSYFLAIKGN